MSIAIIPARGGSKRIPRKNIREFCGKPMIAWSIEAALASGCFERVLVSTEDDEIAKVAESLGAEAPFRRPAELATDTTGTMPVIRHALEWLLGKGEQPEAVCCMHATAPFLRATDLRLCFERMLDSGSDYAFPVTTFASPIQRALRLDGEGRVGMLQPEHLHSRSQDLEEAFHDAAQFWWGRTQAWLDERPVYSRAATAIRIPRHRVQDIDTLEDWQRAELMFQMLKAEGE